jgi:hypothetical protein
MDYLYVHRNCEWSPDVARALSSRDFIFFVIVNHAAVTDEDEKYFSPKFITRYGNIIGDKPLTDEVFHLYLLVDSMKIRSRVLNALFCPVRILNQLKS